jgi:Holliday junction resolvasome RuvABC DNA-binding subunit
MSASADPLSIAMQAAAEPALSKEDEEAISALMGLGFTKNESVQAVKRAREAGAKTTEDIIRKALQSGF